MIAIDNIFHVIDLVISSVGLVRNLTKLKPIHNSHLLDFISQDIGFLVIDK